MQQNRFRRYQLNKKSSIQVRNEHPWVFTGNLSSAASVYQSGQWLKLFDGSNKVLGYGSIRVMIALEFAYFILVKQSVIVFFIRSLEK